MICDLTSVGLKLARSWDHLEALGKILPDRGGPINMTVGRLEERQDEYVARAEQTAPLWPLFGILIGDSVQAMRSALDHLACQLVLAHGGSPSRYTQYPILEDRLSVKGAVRSVEIAGGIDPRALAIIEKTQPYDSTDDPTLHPLWILRQLSNIDKHQSLTVTASSIAITKVQLGLYDYTNPTRQPDGTLMLVPEWIDGQLMPGPYDDGEIVCRWPLRSGGDDRTVSLGAQFATSIYLELAGPYTRIPAYSCLTDLFSFVCQRVVTPLAETCL